MIPTVFGVFFVLFFVVFAVTFARSLSTGWRMSRMMHKAFTLAEQEIDRKMTAATSDTDQTASPPLMQCQHCGSKVARAAQCPNCGASMS